MIPRFSPSRGQLTVHDLLNLKGKRQILMTTALDAWTAEAAQAAGIDIVATGDENVKNIEARVQEIRNAAPDTLLNVPIPMHIPLISDEEAIRWAVTLLRAGADIIHPRTPPERLAAIAKQGIPCRAHVGLVPIISTWIGGIRAVGKDSEEALKVYKDALAYQQAGAVFIEIECVAAKVAAEIARRLEVPVISIGSGSGCDGQILFSADILGTQQHIPRHAKKYRDFFGEAVAAFREFKDEAESGGFPTKDKSIEIKDEEFERFMKELDAL